MDDTTETLRAEVVSRNYFDVLGVVPDLGRSWLLDAREQSDEQLVLISHDLWRRRFASDLTIVGKPIQLSGHNLIIGGVLPRTFRGLDRLIAFDVWISFDTWSSQMNSAREFDLRGLYWLEVWGRLAPDATVDQARAECDLITARLAQEYPATNKDRVSSVVHEAS